MTDKTNGNGRTNIGAREFIAAVMAECQGGEGKASNIAEKLGCKKATVLTRASHYRKQGVPLPKFERKGYTKIDFSDLADFAQSLVTESTEVK